MKGQIDYVGYKISGNGEQYFRPADLDAGFFSTGSPKLCYGRREVLDVTNYTEPAEAMGVKVTNVKFDYKIVGGAPWANNKVIAETYTWLPKKIAGDVAEDATDLALTNRGWVHHSEVK